MIWHCAKGELNLSEQSFGASGRSVSLSRVAFEEIENLNLTLLARIVQRREQGVRKARESAFVSVTELQC